MQTFHAIHPEFKHTLTNQLGTCTLQSCTSNLCTQLLELLGRFASNYERGTRLNNGNVFIIYFYHRFINSKITG